MSSLPSPAMNAPLPRKIRAAVGNKVLSRAPELFRQSFSETIDELLQNARRAGATAVSIDVTPISVNEAGAPVTEITVRDNGSGVSDPQILLTFAGSDWSLDLDTRENAAGMGFFSLARFGAVVRSLNWTARFSPASFRDAEDVIVTESAPIVGTLITFQAPIAADSIRRDIAQAVRYYPVSVTLDGHQCAQGDFLAGATLVKTVLGVRIGVYDTYENPREPNINFFGKTIHETLPTIADVTIAATRLAAGSTSKRNYRVRIDVADAPDLKLVLPARHSVIKDAAFANICGAAKVAIYEYAATIDHQLGYADYTEAVALGVRILPPTLILDTWEFNTDDGSFKSTVKPKHTTLAGDTVNLASSYAVIDLPSLDFEFGVAVATALAAYDAQPNRRFTVLSANRSYIGYRGYDSLPAIDTDNISITVVADKSASPYIFDWDGSDDTRVSELSNFNLAEAISVTLSVSTKNETITNTFPIPVFVFSSRSRGDDVNVFVVRTTTADDAASDIMAATWYDDDDEDNDYRLMRNDIVASLRRLLLGSKEAEVAEIVDAFSKVTIGLFPINDQIVSICLSFAEGAAPRRDVTLTITYNDGQQRTKTL